MGSGRCPPPLSWRLAHCELPEQGCKVHDSDPLITWASALGGWDHILSPSGATKALEMFSLSSLSALSPPGSLVQMERLRSQVL